MNSIGLSTASAVDHRIKEKKKKKKIINNVSVPLPQ